MLVQGVFGYCNLFWQQQSHIKHRYIMKGKLGIFFVYLFGRLIYYWNKFPSDISTVLYTNQSCGSDSIQRLTVFFNSLEIYPSFKKTFDYMTCADVFLTFKFWAKFKHSESKQKVDIYHLQVECCDTLSWCIFHGGSLDLRAAYAIAVAKDCDMFKHFLH